MTQNTELKNELRDLRMKMMDFPIDAGLIYREMQLEKLLTPSVSQTEDN